MNNCRTIRREKREESLIETRVCPPGAFIERKKNDFKQIDTSGRVINLACSSNRTSNKFVEKNYQVSFIEGQ